MNNEGKNAIVLSNWVLKLYDLATAEKGINEDLNFNKQMSVEKDIFDDMKLGVGRIYRTR